MPRLRVITFDLDNTLWNVRTVIGGAERRLVAWLDAETPAAAAIYRNSTDVMAMRSRLIDEQPQLAHDISSLRVAILHQVMRQSGHGEVQARQLAARAFEVLIEARHDIEFFDGALSALANLSRRYALGSLTNGNADPKRLKLDRYFSFSFCAADVGASKPAPELFEAALRHTGAAPHEVAHIGDHPIDDIAAAAHMGLHTIWFNGPVQREMREESASVDLRTGLPLVIESPKAPATVEITHLDELVDAVERIESL